MLATLHQLIEALRNELQQYGEMLALLDHQQELVNRRGAEEILQSISTVNAQTTTIQAAREDRQEIKEKLAREMGRSDHSTFVQLIPLIPEQYRPLVSALVQENNELLERVRARAQENQLLLRRSLELMQRFITTLSTDDHSSPPNNEQTKVLNVEASSPLYEAIV